MAVKLDISKTYDREEWSFPEKMVIKMGMDESWVAFVMETVTTTSYFVLINGELKGFIKPTRGIKQGDLLSPYLFLKVYLPCYRKPKNKGFYEELVEGEFV